MDAIPRDRPAILVSFIQASKVILGPIAGCGRVAAAVVRIEGFDREDGRGGFVAAVQMLARLLLLRLGRVGFGRMRARLLSCR